MNNLKSWGLTVFIGLLIGTATWLLTNDTVKKSEEFAYRDNGILYWLELKSQGEKKEGKLYQKEVIEDIGEVPFIDEKEFLLTGESTEEGYEFKATVDGKIMKIEARFAGDGLLIQEEGEKESKLFHLAGEEELESYEKALQQDLQTALDQWEEKHTDFLRTFFSELESVYGYFHSTEDGSYQLFLKINEALHQGELEASLLKMVDTGDINNPYKEERYTLNGITDGRMLQFFTTVDGQEIKLEGDFLGATSGFHLSFWTTNQKLAFYAVTKEEFDQRYEEFKRVSQSDKENKPE